MTLEQESFEFAMTFKYMTYDGEPFIITSPGKFEGEPLYCPYFWNMSMHGADTLDYDEDGQVFSTFIVTPKDAALFPELNDGDIVSLYEDNLGFVWSSVESTEEDQS